MTCFLNGAVLCCVAQGLQKKSAPQPKAEDAEKPVEAEEKQPLVNGANGSKAVSRKEAA